MYSRWTLLRLDIKKFMGMVPVILMETFLMGLILLGIGVCAEKALYGEKAAGEICVGVVAGEGDRLTEMLLRFVESMDSVRDTVSFVRLSEQEARRRVHDGGLYGAVLVPEGIVDSVNSGENTPVTVLLANDYSQAETEVFAQLTEAGEKLLSVAQAGIYAADAFCVEEGHPEKIQETEDYLNREYLDYAMGRSGFFKEREVSAAQGVSLGDYYGISLLLAFLSFAGLAFGKCMQVEPGQREKLASRWGIGRGQGYLIEAGAFGCVCAFVGTILSFLLYSFLGSLSGSTFIFGAGWLWMILVWFETGVFLRLLIQLTGNHAGGTGLSFAIQMGLMLAAGVFVPGAFLPLWLEKAGRYIPYKNWMECLTEILHNQFDGNGAAASAGRILLFSLTGAAAAWLRDRKSGAGRSGLDSRWRSHEEGSPRLGVCSWSGLKVRPGRKTNPFRLKTEQILRMHGILWKQYWIKYSLWIGAFLLVSFVFGAVGKSFSKGQENQGIAVGICVFDEKGRELLASLQEGEGIFRFEGYGNEDEMLRRINNGSLECGYVFPEGFYDRLADKKLKRQATLYFSPASSVHKIAGETVFAQLFEMISGNVLEKYLVVSGYDRTADFDRAKERLYELNDKYASDGSTFCFLYENGGGMEGEKPAGLNMVRGLMALAVFLMSILGLGNMLEQKNTWTALPGKAAKRFKSGGIHVAAVGSVLTGGACLCLLGNVREPVKELAGLAMYLIVLELFLRLLALFIKSSRALYGLVPVLLLCSCLFCPIFIRIERYLPGLSWISGLFPPSYYLKLFL